jgi:hypothetical protein
MKVSPTSVPHVMYDGTATNRAETKRPTLGIVVKPQVYLDYLTYAIIGVAAKQVRKEGSNLKPSLIPTIKG